MITFYVISGIISVANLVLFFLLCINVSIMKDRIRNELTDFDRYAIFKKDGNNAKAYYYLHCAFYAKLSDELLESEITIEHYYRMFDELGQGVPDYKCFGKFKKKDEELK